MPNRKDLLRSLVRRVLSEGVQGMALNVYGDSLTLYDTNVQGEEGVIGCIGLVEDIRGWYEMHRIAARKGYGKTMAILGMEHASPLPLMVDREGDIKEDAVKMLEKIIANPPSGVSVSEVDASDPSYVECLDWACADEEPEFFRMMNTQFSSNGNTTGGFEITRSEEIDGYGRAFFDSMYMDW